MAAVQLSPAAYERLKAEFDDLTTRGRIDVANKIERAREEGDLKENAGYHAAKDEQGHMEGRIRQLEHLLENAEIVDGSLIYTVVYEGDSDDDAERYLIGNMEEQVDGRRRHQPGVTARQGARRRRGRGHDHLRGAERCAHRDGAPCRASLNSRTATASRS